MDVHFRPQSHPTHSSGSEQAAIDPVELRSLLSSLSHELCRPLASLRAGFDLLLGDASATVTAEQRGHLLTMASLCDELLRLARGYLDYAGLASGGRAPSLGKFSLGAIVREIDRQFAGAARAAGLNWETSADQPDFLVVTDASLCLQIFGNLVSNALKYTPRGGHVRVEVQSGAEDWCVAVVDDGHGIPTESLDRVFDPFFRLPRDEHSRVEGNGLGLSICRELTERLSGTIVLDSTPGAGTTVKVQFPRRLPLPRSPIDPARPSSEPSVRS
jgi:signal transduction histidine kinase